MSCTIQPVGTAQASHRTIPAGTPPNTPAGDHMTESEQTGLHHVVGGTAADHCCEIERPAHGGHHTKTAHHAKHHGKAQKGTTACDQVPMTPGIKQQSSGIAADLKGSNKDMDGILRDLKSGKLHKEDLKVGLPVLKNQAEVYQKLSENPDTPSELKPLYAEAASKINEVIAAINTP